MKANRLIARFLEVLDKLDKEKKNIPGMIFSRPGFGKTSTIKMWCDLKDYNLITVVPSTYSADDILGIQSLSNGKLVRLTPSWFNQLKKTCENGKRTVLFLDELSATDPYIQAPLLNLIFNHTLGEGNVLPDNVFIVAAGNYSEDLDGAFKLSAPMINRFMILNLLQEDFDLDELLEETFSKIKTKEEIREYLDINEDEWEKYDINKIKEWMKTSGEIQLNKAEVTEDTNAGVLGFTSIRSLSYSLQFMQAYFDLYAEDDWVRIAGDTLGVSSKREGIPLKKVFNTYLDTFIKNDNITSKNLGDLCEELISKGNLTSSDYKSLQNCIKRLNKDTYRPQDNKKFRDLAKKYLDNKDMQVLLQQLTEKVLTFY